MKKITNFEQEEAFKSLSDNGWSYDDVKGAIVKKYIFRDFLGAFGWMCKAAIISEKLNHHPEWTNVYKTVEVTLTTHDIGGLSDLDLELAQKFDDLI